MIIVEVPIEHWNNFYKYLKEKSLQILCFLKCLTQVYKIWPFTAQFN